MGPDQVAYIKNSFISTNIRLVQDLFNLYNEKNLPGLFAFVDFKKAFDSIEWGFLLKTLNKFNFGQEFQQWIKLMCIKPIALVKNNGYFSEEFEVSCGVRQGCPVSSLLFVLCLEVLASSVRQNVDIKGLSLDENGIEHAKIVQYADDTTLFLRNTHEMRLDINMLQHFGSVAGTQLNLEKCEGLWIGSYKNR